MASRMGRGGVGGRPLPSARRRLTGINGSMRALCAFVRSMPTIPASATPLLLSFREGFEPSYEDDILDPRNDGPMDYLFQVVRHNHASGWNEWDGTGYNSSVDTDDDSSPLLTPLAKTLHHDTGSRASDVFVWWGHGSERSLGGHILNVSRLTKEELEDEELVTKVQATENELKKVTGVVILIGCRVGDSFGHGDFDTVKPNDSYSSSKDCFPNARVKIGTWTPHGSALLPEEVSPLYVGVFAKLLQLSMGDRKATWSSLVGKVNKKIEPHKMWHKYQFAIAGPDMNKPIWVERS